MIHIQDVQQVAYELKMTLTPEKIAYVIANYDSKSNDDPTGALDLWIEQLLYECEDHIHVDFVNDMIEDLFQSIKTEYQEDSDVCMGEFLIGYTTPQNKIGYYELSSWVVIKALEKIYEWDGTEWRFIVKEDDDQWVLVEVDAIEYDVKFYPTRTFEVTHDEDGSTHTYMVAPEKLSDAMIAKEGEDATVTHGSEAQLVDENIYHYVEDSVFYEDAKFVCEECLDIPMTLIQEITY
jgi:hypothetical protein